jgi:putative DNA primase/helicase
MTSVEFVARRMGGEVISRNRVKCPGPGHSSTDRSLIIILSNNAQDGFSVTSYAGDDWRECRDYVRDKLGYRWQPPPSTGVADKSAEERRDIAFKIWCASRPARGTLVERYLTDTRKLELPDTLAIRYHPRLKVTGTEQFAPAMVCALADIETNAFTGIHRTFLTPDAQKIKKATLGVKVGSAIKIDPHDAVTDGLAIAEGVETTIAARRLYRPAWCVVDAGGIEHFPVLERVGHIEIFADNDATMTGLRAARACQRRWLNNAREARIVMPTDVGCDIADLVAEGVLT